MDTMTLCNHDFLKILVISILLIFLFEMALVMISLVSSELVKISQNQ